MFSLHTNDSVHSSNSGTSWSSIIKRLLKINAPKISIEVGITTTNKISEDLSNEIQFTKTIKTKIDEEAIPLTSSLFLFVMKTLQIIPSSIEMRVSLKNQSIKPRKLYKLK